MDHLTDTVLQMSIEQDELDLEEPDLIDLYSPEETLHSEATKYRPGDPKNGDSKMFVSKHTITGPSTHQPSVDPKNGNYKSHTATSRTPIQNQPQTRTPIQNHLSRRTDPYPPVKRTRTEEVARLATPKPCPLPSPFNVPPPPIRTQCPSDRKLNIPPLVLTAKPKLTPYMIDTLTAQLIQNCRTNFNIRINEDETKRFLENVQIE